MLHFITSACQVNVLQNQAQEQSKAYYRRELLLSLNIPLQRTSNKRNTDLKERLWVKMMLVLLVDAL